MPLILPPHSILPVYDPFRLLRTDQLEGFYSKDAVFLRLFQPYLPFQPAMGLAVTETIVIPGISCKPADFLFGRLLAEVTGGGGNFPVSHGIVLVGEGFGDELGIGAVLNQDFFFPAAGNAVIVDGKIVQQCLFVQLLHDAGGVDGVTEGIMEGSAFRQIQEI